MMSHIFTESMLGRFHDIEFQGFQWQQKTHFCIFYCQIRITITLQWSTEISGKARCGCGIYKHISWSQNLFEIPHDLQFTADFPMSTSVHFASPTPYFRGGGFFLELGETKQFPIGIKVFLIASFFSGSLKFTQLVKKVVATFLGF